MPTPKRNRPIQSLTLDPEIVERAKHAAWAEKMSLSAYVDRAIERYLTDHPSAL